METSLMKDMDKLWLHGYHASLIEQTLAGARDLLHNNVQRMSVSPNGYTSKFNTEGNPAVDWHPIGKRREGGVNIILIT